MGIVAIFMCAFLILCHHIYSMLKVTNFPPDSGVFARRISTKFLVRVILIGLGVLVSSVCLGLA